MDKIPELSRQTSVVVLTADERVEIGLTALRLGARAIVEKRFAIETLLYGYPGGRGRTGLGCPPAMQAALVGQDGPAAKRLTPRESEIVRCVAVGMRNAEVAARLLAQREHSENSFDQHFHKLKSRSIELTRYAMRPDWCVSARIVEELSLNDSACSYAFGVSPKTLQTPLGRLPSRRHLLVSRAALMRVVLHQTD